MQDKNLPVYTKILLTICTEPYFINNLHSLVLYRAKY